MTILFRGETQQDILIINRDRQIMYNPLEDLDEDEKFAVLADIINSDPVQN